MDTNLSTENLLREGVQELQGSSATAFLDAEVLLAHALNIPRARLKSHSETPVKEGNAERYRQLLARRTAGEPVAYLVGYKDFWTLRLAVTPAVLVPRPETELLVERALTLCEAPDARVVDLGTGSGAIALALASERPQWRIAAVEASEEALRVARANARALQLEQVKFLRGSWFDPLRERRFHLIVSNPPYIAADDPVLAPQVYSALQYEPRQALQAGDEGLADLRAIIAGAPQHLERGGWLILEHGAQQAPAVTRELEKRGFTRVRSHRDLAGHERVTEGYWG